MHDWNTCRQRASEGNPVSARPCHRSEERWRLLLAPERYAIARRKGTERPFGPDYCPHVEPGRYRCACCEALLFEAAAGFVSGTGWPSFTQPIADDAVAYHWDRSHGSERIEVTCNSCGAHLGHVFPDGPPPSDLRYCINAAVLERLPPGAQLATIGGGCFWCTQAQFQLVEGVYATACGYSGGHDPDPDYAAVCSGSSGHVEVVQIVFDPERLPYDRLLQLHLAGHDPTSRDRQGADVGSQYRSVIFTHDAPQSASAQAVIAAAQEHSPAPIVTVVAPLDQFHRAEYEHQNYFRRHPEAGYCQAVIAPKLAALRRHLAGG